MNAVTRHLNLGSERIEYAVRYSRRRTLTLYVFPDRRVEVRVPLGCPDELIQRFVTSRVDWVAAKRREFAGRPARPKRARETRAYLGREYPLEIQIAEPSGVWLAGERLLVRCRRKGEAEPLLTAWYRRQAEKLFAQRLAHWHARAALRVPMPALRIRAMRSRWGSCSPRGGITLNLELMRYPRELIDYVVVHELCHLREFNHGPGFYALMERILPDWAERKARLKELAREMGVD